MQNYLNFISNIVHQFTGKKSIKRINRSNLIKNKKSFEQKIIK